LVEPPSLFNGPIQLLGIIQRLVDAMVKGNCSTTTFVLSDWSNVTEIELDSEDITAIAVITESVDFHD